MELVNLMFLCSVCMQSTLSQTLKDANSLYEKFTKNYNKKVRPGEDQSQPTHVFMSTSILSVNEFEEKNNRLSVSMGFHIEWMDERIRWNSSDYGGIEFVQLPNDDVWLPVISLVNMYESVSLLSELDTKIKYNSTGYAKWDTGGIFVVVCAADISFYPFDTQECAISFTHVGYSMTQLLIYPGQVFRPTMEFVPNGIWETLNTYLSREVDETLSLQVIHVNLKLRRRFDFYAVTLLAPITITMFCNLFVFLIPATSGERVSFSVTILLSMTVFMTIVSDTLPKNSYPDLPYLCFSILMDVVASSVITACSIITMRVHFREDDDNIPACLKQLSRCCCCKHTNSRLKPNRDDETTKYDPNMTMPYSASKIKRNAVERRMHLTNGYCKGLPRINIDNVMENEHERDGKYETTWKDVGNMLDMLLFTITAILMAIKLLIYVFMFTQKALA